MVQFRIGCCLSELCARGCGEKGSFFHILRSCPKIQRFWRGVARIMETVVGEKVPLESRWHILGVTGEITWPQWAKTWLALGGGSPRGILPRRGGQQNPGHWKHGSAIWTGATGRNKWSIKAGDAPANGRKYGGHGLSIEARARGPEVRLT